MTSKPQMPAHSTEFTLSAAEWAQGRICADTSFAIHLYQISHLPVKENLSSYLCLFNAIKIVKSFFTEQCNLPWLGAAATAK